MFKQIQNGVASRQRPGSGHFCVGGLPCPPMTASALRPWIPTACGWARDFPAPLRTLSARISVPYTWTFFLAVTSLGSLLFGSLLLCVFISRTRPPATSSILIRSLPLLSLTTRVAQGVTPRAEVAERSGEVIGRMERPAPGVSVFCAALRG